METEIADNSYKIKTDVFEGPFSLLLNLVEKRKLFINDVSLATVTEDYLKYVNEISADNSETKSFNPDEISSFVMVAATLILIKSKSLLPNLDLTEGEEADIKNLEERLRLYKIFTEQSVKIKSVFGKKMIFAPLDRKIDTLVFLPDDQISKSSMMGFARDVLGALPKKISLPTVEVKKIISIEEMIDKLTDRIQQSLRLNFKDFAGKTTTREEKVFVIVGFLAMLELVRNGILHAVQENNSDDIIISRRPEGVGIPTEASGEKN